MQPNNGNAVKYTTGNGLAPAFGYIRITKAQKLKEWYLYG